MMAHFCLEELLGVHQFKCGLYSKAAQMCKQSLMTGALKQQVQFLHAQVLLVSLHAAMSCAFICVIHDAVSYHWWHKQVVSSTHKQ